MNLMLFWSRSQVVTAPLLLAGLLSLPDAALAAPPAVGDRAPDFESQSIQGTRIKLSDLTSKGPVVLVFLRGYPGYQCPICNTQVGDLIARSSQFEELGARILLVYPGPSENLKQRASEFIQGKTLPGNFVLLLDPDYDLVNRYGVRWNARKETAYPSAFTIDREGVVRFSKISRTHGGRAKASELLQAIPR